MLLGLLIKSKVIEYTTLITVIGNHSGERLYRGDAWNIELVKPDLIRKEVVYIVGDETPGALVISVLEE